MVKLIFLALLVFGVVIRFMWLDKAPPGLSHDEVDPIHTARTYIQFGTDSTGTHFPASLITSQVNSGDDTLLSLFYAPFYRFFPLSMFTLKLQAVAINLLTALSLFILIYRISHRRHLACIYLLVFLFSPWSVLFSRSLTQAPLALLLITLSFNMFIRFTAISTVISSLLLFTGFFTYFGAKPLSVILSIGFPFLTYFIRSNKFKLSQAVTYFTVFTVCVGIYLFLSLQLPTSTFFHRQSEARPIDPSSFARSVDELRRVSIDSPVAPIFSNKPLLLLTSFVQKYYTFFSPEILYFSGDVDPNFRFLDHGVSYLIDAPLFIFGLPLSLSSPVGFLAIFMLLVGPVGTIVNTSSLGYLFRGFLFYPGYLLVISLGLYSLQRKFGVLGLITSSVCYLLLVVNFLYFYFFRLPVSQSESYFLGDRVVANYVLRLPSNVTIIAHQPFSLAQEISIFGSIQAGLPAQQLSRAVPLTLHNAEITNVCPSAPVTQALIVQSGFDCQLPSGLKQVVIQNQKDAGSLWTIYFDPLCQDYTLSAWRRFKLPSHYHLENMSN